MGGHSRNIPVKMFQNLSTGLASEVILSFLLYSSGGQLVQQSETVSIILVEDQLRNIPVCFQNPSAG